MRMGVVWVSKLSGMSTVLKLHGREMSFKTRSFPKRSEGCSAHVARVTFHAPLFDLVLIAARFAHRTFSRRCHWRVHLRICCSPGACVRMRGCKNGPSTTFLAKHTKVAYAKTLHPHNNNKQTTSAQMMCANSISLPLFDSQSRAFECLCLSPRLYCLPGVESA